MNFTPIGTILSSRLNDLIIYAQFLSHVIQQKTGRIKPDSAINGLPVNTDPRLEQQADSLSLLHRPAQQQSISSPVVQRYSNFAYPQNTNAVYNFGFHRDIYHILKADAAPPPLRSRASAPSAQHHTGGTPPVSCSMIRVPH